MKNCSFKMGGLSLGDNLVIFNYFGACGLIRGMREELLKEDCCV